MGSQRSQDTSLWLASTAVFLGGGRDNTVEYRIPFDSVCTDGCKPDRGPFKIGGCKTAGPASVSEWQPGAGPAGWVVWVGTGSRNWEMWHAGMLEFAR